MEKRRGQKGKTEMSLKLDSKARISLIIYTLVLS